MVSGKIIGEEALNYQIYPDRDFPLWRKATNVSRQYSQAVTLYHLHSMAGRK